MAEIAVSIVTFNNEATITRCLESLREQHEIDDEAITVFDNASSDDTCQIIKNSHASVHLVENASNIGFGAAHNQLLQTCSSDFVLLLNPDAWLLPDALSHLYTALSNDDSLALAGPRVEYEDGRAQLSFGAFPGLVADLKQRRLTRRVQAGHAQTLTWLEDRLKNPFSPDWISASCALLRRKHLEEGGFFDENFFLYWEDVDLCRRLSLAGYHIRVEPSARCRHLEGYSQPEAADQRLHFRRSRLIYENKYGSRLGFALYKLLRARSVDLNFDKTLVWSSPGRK